jgi:membrane-associated phospholipid phosphatase
MNNKSQCRSTRRAVRRAGVFLLSSLGAPHLAQAAPVTPPVAPAGAGIVLRAGQAQHTDLDINSFGDHAGHYLSRSLSPLALAGGAFLLYDSRRHPVEARDALTGIILTGLETEILKRSVNEKRPNGGNGSFPSGHASLAFSMATALSAYHPKYDWLAYGTAAAISAARVEVDAHYWHDVVTGAALGFFTTKYFMRHHHGVAVTPGGIGLQKQF